MTEENQRSPMGKLRRQAVGEGQIVTGPVTHRDPADDLRADGLIGVRTKPSMAPLSYALWLAIHSWLGRDGSWQVVGMRKACWMRPSG